MPWADKKVSKWVFATFIGHVPATQNGFLSYQEEVNEKQCLGLRKLVPS